MLRGHCSVTYNSQKVGTTKRPSTDEQISQVWYINITEYHSALKRKAVWTLSSLWVNLEDIMLNKPDTKGQILYDFTYIRFLEWVSS